MIIMFEVGFTPYNCNLAVEILFNGNKTKAAAALGLPSYSMQRYCREKNYQTMPHEKWLLVVELLKAHKKSLDTNLKQTATKKQKVSNQEPTLF